MVASFPETPYGLDSIDPIALRATIACVQELVRRPLALSGFYLGKLARAAVGVRGLPTRSVSEDDPTNTGPLTYASSCLISLADAF